MSKVVSSTLKEYFREQGKTQQEIADDLGVSQAYIGQILNGMKPIGKQTASKLNSLYGFNRGWLLTGEGDMLTTSQPSDTKEVQATPLPDKESYLLAEKLGMEIVPEYSDTFKGGSAGSFITSDTVNAYWGLPNIKADIIAEIDGDSMYPKYPPGSKVALREIPFDPSAPTVGIPFGEVFGITIDNGDDNYLNIIKRLRRHSDPKLSQSYWICQSENTNKYDDFDIEVSKVRHLFVVVASIHLNRM